MPHRRLALLFVLAGVVVGVVLASQHDEPDRAPAAGDMTDATGRPRAWPSSGLAPALAGLEQLQEFLRGDSTADNDTVVAWMRFVKEAYMSPPPPPGADVYPKFGAVVDVLDLSTHAKEKGWTVAYLNEVQAYRRSVEEALLQALTLQHVDPETNTNTRGAVNAAAAHLLGGIGNADLSDDLIEILETVILKATYEVSQDFLDEAYIALGQLGDQDALAWMVKHYTSLKSGMPPYVRQLNAAHKAMCVFYREKVDGRLRHKLVYEMIKNYTPVEAQGLLGGWRLAAWAQHIGPDAIRTTQYFAGDPVDDDGQPLDTMQELAEWFRDHRDPSKPPWTND